MRFVYLFIFGSLERMSYNIIMPIIDIFATLVQLLFQSPIDTRSGRIIYAFLVALVAYGFLEYLLAAYRNDDTELIRFLRENRLSFGAFPCVLLLHILSPIVGWVTSVVWICYVVKKASDEMVYRNVSIADILGLVRDASFKVLDKFKHAFLCGSPEDESPV